MDNESSIKFTQDFHFLIALISHLSATRHKNRTPRDIAGSLAMEHKEIKRVLLQYPAFFRQSIHRSVHTKERLFTVHLRYALRRKHGRNDNYDEPLPPESVSIMINLVTEMVRNEREEARNVVNLLNRNRTTRWTVFAALGTALFSSLTAILIAIIK